MTADLTHLAGRIPDGQGHPAEAMRHRQGASTGQHVQIAARIVVDAFASGDEGAAHRYLHGLRHDPETDVDPWLLIEAVTVLALRHAAGTSQAG